MLTPPERLTELIAAYRRRYGGIKQKILADGAKALREMMTGQRPLRPGYLAKPNLRQAYVCYCLAIHYAKARLVLQELRGFAALPAEPSVLDFGCGPGTASLAAIDELGRPRLTLVDVVSEALEDATFLIDTYAREPVKLRRHPEVPQGRFDVAIASNVIVEMGGVDAARRILERSVAPEGYLVVIEPALPEPTRRLMAWRDELAAAGWRIAAPCLGVARCPMRSREDLWCHQERPWNAPAFVDEIDRRLGVDHEALKYSYLIVTREGAVRPGTWRVVSNLHREKGKAWAWLCGRPSEPLVAAELLTRHRSAGTAAFEHARRGDVLDIEPAPAGRLPEGVSVVKR
jgi:ribosomal protein RSM22 (predicted rRNA methylase)